MLFGVRLLPRPERAVKDPGGWYDENLGLAGLIDALGYEHLRIAELKRQTSGQREPDWLTLGAVAALTVGVRIVTVEPYRASDEPVDYLDKLVMADHLSHGRLDFYLRGDLHVVPAGEARPPAHGSQYRHVDVVSSGRQLWGSEDATAPLLPYQNPHPPVFVTPSADADTYADVGRAGLHVQVSPSDLPRERLQDAIEAYREARVAGGWGPGRIRLRYACYLDPDGRAALTAARRGEGTYRKDDFERNTVLAGTPAQVADQLATIAEWFGEDVSVSLRIGPGSLIRSEAESFLWLFAEQVAPQFTGPPSGLRAS